MYRIFEICYTRNTPMKLRLILLSAAIIATLPLPSRTQSPMYSIDPYRDEPFVFERYDTTTTMKADGTGDVVQHVIVRVQSDGVARQFSVLNLSYASANSTATMEFVRVHKPDGSTINTPVNEAMEMPAEVTREAPMYSDLKEKHLPVRSLASGDRLEYQFHTVLTKAQAPGQFWGAEHFLVQGGVVLEQSLTLAVPEKTYVQVWSPNHKTTPVRRDGMQVWTWTSSQIKASARDENGKMTAAEVKDPDEDADGRKLPSVAWTTFRSWAEVGDWYRSLAEQRLQPTASVRAKADELTKNAKTPQEQAEALYRFVATQIRYISLSFGVGRFQPHTPDEVLDHGYGDCKDKDTLLESLLRSKGMTTAPVLIGAGIAPVTEVPSPSVFNHAITTVELPDAAGKPEQVWLDSTAEVAPFRVLMPIIRDQQALVIPDKAPASLERTPANPPYTYHEEFVAVGTLDSDGLMKSHMVLTARSDSELDLRIMMQRLSPAQWDDAMQYLSGAMGFGGKVSGTDMRQADASAPVKITYDYSREKYAGWENKQSLPLFPVVELTLVSEEKAPEHDIDLGAPRTVEAHSTITLPAGYRAELPDAVHVSREFATYDKTYRLVDGKVIADRKLVVKVHKLPRDRWKDYLAFQKATLVNDGEPYLRLIPPDHLTINNEGAKSASTAPAKDAMPSADPSNPSDARQQLAEIAAMLQRRDIGGARSRLEALRKSSPDAPYVLGMLGLVKASDGDLDAAARDIEAEMKAHPDDDPSMVLGLAQEYSNKQRYSDAEALLGKYGGSNARVQQMRVFIYNKQGDYTHALGVLRDLQARQPEDRAVASQVASTLYELHRNEEAAMAAKKAMDGSDDPDVINNNVYVLSETKIDLPFAETQSRRSVELLEKMTASQVLEEANTKAFAASANLTASWDTLGYILLLEGKPKEAAPYLRAAWFSQENIIVGNHLAQTFEALDRNADALWMYRLSRQTEHAGDAKQDYAEVAAAIARLEKNGVKAASGESFPTSMQDFRSYHVKNSAGAEGGGTVRLQLNADGVAAAMLVSGDAKLRPLLDETKSLRLPGAEPAGSPARILRDAVVYCGKKSATCDFVLMLNSGIAVEGAAE
ncbi:transglutaminase domain-containing protein [Terriglobus saanensis SP1PR4]|uniref:Transglutaminase domain-containing protein n=2 Tax=Terriglobus saanensis TaxID=870903 RepID=E8V4B0_TERSS|nr:transglutaminase domain-containing protein [Terriglobus saanensis SP1PR4]